MVLAFDSKLLRMVCEQATEAYCRFGPTVAKMLHHRLADLRAATVAKDLVVGQPCVLKSTDGQEMAVDLCEGYRIVFSANHPNNPKLETGDVDWTNVSRIKILGIEKSHA